MIGAGANAREYENENDDNDDDDINVDVTKTAMMMTLMMTRKNNSIRRLDDDRMTEDITIVKNGFCGKLEPPSSGLLLRWQQSPAVQHATSVLGRRRMRRGCRWYATAPVGVTRLDLLIYHA